MKRMIIGFVVALIAITLTPEMAAAAPLLTLNPPCVNNTTGSMTLTFSGTGFTDDAIVRIYDESQPNRPPIIANTNKSGSFTVQATVPAKPPGYYFYRAEEGNTILSKAVNVPCGTISIDPTCGPAGGPPETYTITVNGVAFPPSLVEQPNYVDITFAGAPAGNGQIDFDGRFGIKITVPRRPAGFYSIVATDRRDKHSAFIRFTVPCLETTSSTNTTVTTTVPDVTVTTAKPPPPSPTPSCVLDPPVGPPGFVTSARCSGFPPNATAALRWDPGLGTSSAAIGPLGTFVAPMLILPRDRLGPRTFFAEALGVSATAPFIVVPPSVAPSGGDVATRLLPQLVRRY